jgi:hypothetical protein
MLSISEVESIAGTSMDMLGLADDKGFSNNVDHQFGERAFSPESMIGLKWEVTAF